MKKKLQKYCIDERRTIKEAVSTIQNSMSRCVVVLNESGKVVGVFSEGDVLRAILQNIDLYTPIRNIIKPSFHYLNRRDMLQAYNLVQNHGITMIPVIDERFVLKDVITIFDVMKHLAFINDKE